MGKEVADRGAGAGLDGLRLGLGRSAGNGCGSRGVCGGRGGVLAAMGDVDS